MIAKSVFTVLVNFGLIPWRGPSLRAITGLECKWAHINFWLCAHVMSVAEMR